MIKNRIPIVLASASPRRREILQILGFDLEIIPAEIDELAIRHPNPAEQVVRIAQAKARKIAPQNKVVVAADTSVVVDDLVLEKPIDVDDARRMLKMLSGRSHQVLTAVCILFPTGHLLDFVEKTQVSFRAIDESALENYINTTEPYDKAGAYGVQNAFGMSYVERIEGCYFNVMGFPASRFMQLLAENQKSDRS